jgi:gamma-glutamyl-gamma-aminobutyrate hydrolase PuuD
MSKPLVGICPNLKHIGERNGYFLQPDYAAIVSEGGALPVILPFVSNRQEAREFLERIDGVLLTGGPDIDPIHYGQTARDPERYPLAAPERTRSDFAYAQEAKDRGMPLLGICLGIQSINVAFGGSLLQHISDDVPTAMAHDGGAHSRFPRAARTTSSRRSSAPIIRSSSACPGTRRGSRNRIPRAGCYARSSKRRGERGRRRNRACAPAQPHQPYFLRIARI